MKPEIICHRCGHTEAPAATDANDWDEINCMACGEFLTTHDYQCAIASRDYQLHALSLSIEHIIAMSRSKAGGGPAGRILQPAA
ncbi:hypothetical protein [Salinicola avicenniae]|uniref:hypothetical protein n=1 Tax=Salinicola avicenniae TaxID=2916836 RepID=UPI002073849A|nr:MULTISPECIES: hypothetical protein [unclassified Salinicola]